MKRTSGIIILFAGLILLAGCKKNKKGATTGQLKGIVKDATTAAPLENVSVIIFNADNNSPTGQTLKTDANGEFSDKLVQGNYFVKLSRQGYYSVPPPTLEAIPFAINVSQITQKDAEMFPSGTNTAGWVEGMVTSNGNPVRGALVVATDGTGKTAFSTISDAEGNYAIFNVPAGSFNIKAYMQNYNSDQVAATVNTQTVTAGVNITMQKNAGATLSGSIRNLSIANKDVDISLVHPITKETIPGLTTSTSSLNYSLSNIPNGTYIARATYKNDERVMDPDRIAKFGEPIVTVSGGTSSPATLTFDITGPVTLKTPTNVLTSTVPVSSGSVPTFQWTAYSSTSDYVIEVTDASTGLVVWGGFDKSGTLPVKNIVIPSNQTSISYNADGNAAVSSLVEGKIYRWRIYASKNDVNSPTGWTLISVSEDQEGLIKIGSL